MNNQSPLVPQGSLLEQKNKGRARVKIAVFFVLAIHGIGLLALLMQGCQKDKDNLAQNEATNSVPAPSFEPTNAPVVPETNVPVAASNAAPVMPLDAGSRPAPVEGVTEHTIVAGDTFSTIAKHYHVSVKAITDANPGVDPAKLQIGKKIHIPAPTTAATASRTAAADPTLAAGEKIHTVKSGDTLLKIAADYGTTVKAIRAANNLKTDGIKVGDKLKIPAKSSSEPAPAAPAPR